MAAASNDASRHNNRPQMAESTGTSPLRVELSLESSTAPSYSSSSHPILTSHTISYHCRVSRDDIDSSLNIAPQPHQPSNTLRQELLRSSQLLVQWQTKRSRRATMVSHPHQLDRRHVVEVSDALATMAPPQRCQASSCRDGSELSGLLSHPVSRLSQHNIIAVTNARIIADASAAV